MYNIEFNNKMHVHFVGIGGISMSALAEILISKEFTVSGSDSKESALTQKLSSQGASIFYGHNKENITKDIDLVVHTAAVKEDNPEIIMAKELNIPVVTRAVFLGQIMKNYDVAIGVSGTHGKTTTTSMISQVMIDGETDPTVLVGGILDSINGNIRLGRSKNFITEACEYTNSFLSFFPSIGVILNISADHMDFFKDLDDIRLSFKKYAALLPSDGTLIINSGIDNLSYITEGLEADVVTFGLDPKTSDYYPANISRDELADCSYDLYKKGEFVCKIELSVPGIHNVLNSLAAFATCETMGIQSEAIISSLKKYAGCERRFQLKGTVGGVTIIDDYAHHPDEIRATLETVADYPAKTKWCVFQPHTYTRTKAFLTDFAKALSLADKVVLADIYAAREKNIIGITSEDLLDELKKLGADAYYFPSFDEIETFLLQNIVNGDLLITMGAGDVVLIGEKLLGNK